LSFFTQKFFRCKPLAAGIKLCPLSGKTGKRAGMVWIGVQQDRFRKTKGTLSDQIEQFYIGIPSNAQDDVSSKSD